MLPKQDIQKKEIHIKDYVQVVLRRKWIVIVSLITLVTTVTIFSFKATPIYQATTQVMIDREDPHVVSFEEVMSLDLDRRNVQIFYQTQYKILASRSLALRVMNSLNLKDSPEFRPDEGSRGFSIKDFLGLFVKKPRPEEESHKTNEDSDKDDENSKLDKNSRLIDSYLGKLEIDPIRNSRLVNISFKGVHPDIITTIANKHAEEYIERNLEMRFAASQDGLKWLQKQLYGKREMVEKAENTLQLYKEKEGVLSLEGRQNIIVQKLEESNAALTRARTERIGLETLYNLSKEYSETPGMIESLPEIIENPLIRRLKTKYIELSIEVTKLSDKYGKNHPVMIRHTSQAKDLKNKIDAEVNKIVKSLEAGYRVALSKEESLSRALEEEKEKALKLNRKAIAYGTLKRESESERNMYETLLKKMQETDVKGQMQTSNIRIVDLAAVPRFPIAPNKKLNIILGTIVGLVLGISMVFFLEYLDNTIKRPEDVEQYLAVPLLGVLEKIKAQVNGKPTTSELITHEMPKSIFAETTRNIRTGIMSSFADKPGKLILITSATQGEGKTFVASNLAITIAQMGKNTLMVETDFRKPRINKIFNATRNPGLTNHLIGETDFESIIKSTCVPNLSVAMCGFLPPNPSELLGSTAMETFCKTVRERFDMVIFDSPPAMVVTDAIVLSRIMDGLIIVIKSDVTARETAKRAISRLTSNECEMLGAVVNCVDISRGSYYYHYYSPYYKYGYGSEEDLKETEKI